jgi:hypothetical protein
MTVYRAVQGNRKLLRAQLRDKVGPIDLSGADNIVANIGRRPSDPDAIQLFPSIEDGPNGVVSLALTNDNFLGTASGDYVLEWEIRTVGVDPITVPTKGTDILIVRPRIPYF